MDKPNASLPWASSQVTLVGSCLRVVPELLRCLCWDPWRSASLHFPESCDGNRDRLVEVRSANEACCSCMRGGLGNLPALQV